MFRMLAALGWEPIEYRHNEPVPAGPVPAGPVPAGACRCLPVPAGL
jgi:hypothetical protein